MKYDVHIEITLSAANKQKEFDFVWLGVFLFGCNILFSGVLGECCQIYLISESPFSFDCITVILVGMESDKEEFESPEYNHTLGKNLTICKQTSVENLPR